MPYRHHGLRNEPVSAAPALHISSLGTALPVGACVSLSSIAQAITGGQANTITLTAAQMMNIEVGQRFNVNNGATGEDIVVSSKTPTSFTATFVNSYASNAWKLISYRGTALQTIIINNPGTSITITLYNGSPNLFPLPTTQGAIATISPTVNVTLAYGAICDLGLFYTVAGTTAGSYTLMYIDSSV